MMVSNYVGKTYKYRDFYGKSWDYIITGIYKISNTINNKVYIGESVNVRERWLRHVRNAFRYNEGVEKDWTDIVKTIGNYGVENFTFEVLDVEYDHYKRKEKEMLFIKEYGSTDQNKGYNSREGFVGGVTRREKEEVEIESIKMYLRDSKIPILEIANKHNVNKLTVWRINKGISYKNNKEDYPIRKDIIGKQLAKGLLDVTGECIYCKDEGKLLRSRLVYCTEECYEKHKKVKQEIKNNIAKSREKVTGKCGKCGKKANVKTLNKYDGMCSICCKEVSLERGFLYSKSKQKVYKEVLYAELHKMTFLEVGNLYGVSDNAVRKWCERFNLPTDYKSYRKLRKK